MEPVDACAISNFPERCSGCVEGSFLSWLICFFFGIVHDRVYSFPGGFRVYLQLKVAPYLAVPGGIMFLRLWNYFSV